MYPNEMPTEAGKLVRGYDKDISKEKLNVRGGREGQNKEDGKGDS